MNASISKIEEREQGAMINYKSEVSAELRSILSYWAEHTIDDQYGGFYGSINNNNIPDTDAPKGSVLNSRILWTFSAAYAFTQEPAHLALATRAFNYILDHFIDKEYGGVFWSVDHQGNQLDGRKQI